MKFSHMKGLAKHLEEAAPNHLCPVYLVLSKEEYDRRQAYTALKGALEKAGSVEVTRLDPKQLTPKGLKSEMEAYSLLASSRLLHIPRIEELPRATKEALQHLIETPPQGLVLFTEGESGKEKRLIRAIEEHGVVLELATPSNKEAHRHLVEWLLQEAFYREGAIERDAAHHLVSVRGDDKNQLANELEKLLCYVGRKRSVTLVEVKELCPGEVSESTWELGRSIMLGNQKKALQILEGILHEGAEPLAVLSHLRYQIQTSFQVLELSQLGSTHEVTKKFPYMKGWVLDKNLEVARKFGGVRFRQALISIQAAEVKAKNQIRTVDILLQTLVAAL